MEEVPENGKESSHSAHVDGVKEWDVLSLTAKGNLNFMHPGVLEINHRQKHNFVTNNSFIHLVVYLRQVQNLFQIELST
jgi:hypothetical protein